MAAAPRFVLLLREVQFVVGEAALANSTRQKEAADPCNHEATEAALQAMKPELSIFEPPEVSRLTMVQQMRGVPLPPGGGLISGTDKALVVLRAGHFCPGFTRSPSSGCYLVYDASTSSLSAVPQIPPPSPQFLSLGHGTAILSRGGGGGGGAYLLAEIGTSGSGYDLHGVLYLWRQCSTTSQDQEQSRRQWERKSVRLPPQVTDPTDEFSIDMTFSYAGSSCICWVDLLKGVLVCDLMMNKAADPDHQEPEFTFVPLPQGYSIDLGRRPRPRPVQFRTMGCVNGVIKFVALVGYYENSYGGGDDLMLGSWTLSADLREWKECEALAVKDLWESKSFCERNLPRISPTFPVLSVDEDEVVYLSLKEIERKDVYDEYGQFEGVQFVTNAHHVLRVDVVQNKVLHCTKYTQGPLLTLYWPILLAAEFTSYLHNHEEEKEAS